MEKQYILHCKGSEIMRGTLSECKAKKDEIVNVEKNPVRLENLIFHHKITEIKEYTPEEKEELSLNERLVLQGIKTIHTDTEAFLEYNGQRIERPVYNKAERVIKEKFGLDI